MANTRNKKEAKEKALNSAENIRNLIQSARESKVLGIGLCSLNPSGCYDIAKRISLQLHNVPFIRVQYVTLETVLFHSTASTATKKKYTFLDEPPKDSTKYETVFFTGCGIAFSRMSFILNALSTKYQFTNIQYVYEISPPHHSTPRCMKQWQSASKEKAQLFAENTSYQYRLLYSGVDNFPLNIGMPRFELKASEFKVPLECYGVIRHRNMDDFLPVENNKCLPPIEKHFNEYFRQVADAGKDCVKKPLMVIAIGIKPTHRQRILEIAQQYSIHIDFCDQYSDYRLPDQGDFFKVLSVMKDRKAIVSLDDNSTQCLLQALSFEVPVMIYSEDNPYPEFYAQLVNLIPIEYQLTARVILGLSDHYELFRDREKCHKVYKLLHLKINEAHQRFDDFRECDKHSDLIKKFMFEEKIPSTIENLSNKETQNTIFQIIEYANKKNKKSIFFSYNTILIKNFDKKKKDVIGNPYEEILNNLGVFTIRK
jgi:hypothetical protein